MVFTKTKTITETKICKLYCSRNIVHHFFFLQCLMILNLKFFYFQSFIVPRNFLYASKNSISLSLSRNVHFVLLIIKMCEIFSLQIMLFFILKLSIFLNFKFFFAQCKEDFFSLFIEFIFEFEENSICDLMQENALKIRKIILELSEFHLKVKIVL